MQLSEGETVNEECTTHHMAEWTYHYDEGYRVGVCVHCGEVEIDQLDLPYEVYREFEARRADEDFDRFCEQFDG